MQCATTRAGAGIEYLDSGIDSFACASHVISEFQIRATAPSSNDDILYSANSVSQQIHSSMI